MATDTQEYEMGNDNQTDINQDEQMNGSATENGGENQVADSGSAEAPGKDDDRKLFVGGLSWETSDKELREHFNTYGTIESINVKTDPNTGRSRGFAFIVFKAAESIDKVLAAGDHVINNKKIDPKKAKARHGKIFVGGLSTELSDEDIKNYFAQYGTIVDVEMPFDKSKNQRKGFCFITFESEQVVAELLKAPKQTINGKEVDVKKATPKPDGMAGMRGGYDYAGGYGGYGSYDGYGGYSNYDGGYSGGRGGGGRGKDKGYSFWT
uniref:Putative rna-binding protein musashi/mrna cleavage and polyadenylation factor i complex n=1 Tax=Rhodnius prolixus TaxID=13249 RepID=R4G3V0_RHOPR